MKISTLIFITLFAVLAYIAYKIVKIIYKNIGVSFEDKIKKLIEKKEYTKAQNILKKTLPASERSNMVSKIHKLLGDVYFATENYSLSSVEYRESIRLGEASLKVQMLLAKSLKEIGSLEESLSEYIAVYKKEELNSEALFEIGRIYYETGEYKTAYDYLSKSLLANSKNYEALKYKGAAALEAYNYTDAISCLLSAVKKFPLDGFTNYSIAKAHRARKDYQSAIKNYTISLRDQIYVSKSLFERSICYSALGDTGNAIKDLEECINYLENDKDLSIAVKYSLGNLYEKIRNIDLAIGMWESVLLLDYNYKDTLEKLNKYQDLRYSDNIKRFFNSSEEEIRKRSLTLSIAMLLTPYMVKKTKNYVIIFNREGLGVRAPVRIIFVRISKEPIYTENIMKLFEYTKMQNVLKSFLITCGIYSQDTLRLATTSHIEIITIKKLELLLQKSIATSPPSSINYVEEPINL